MGRVHLINRLASTRLANIGVLNLVAKVDEVNFVYPSHLVSPAPALGSFGIAECHGALSEDSPISPRGRPGCSDHRECTTRLDDICLLHTPRGCLSCEMTNCSAGEQLSWFCSYEHSTLADMFHSQLCALSGQ